MLSGTHHLYRNKEILQSWQPMLSHAFCAWYSYIDSLVEVSHCPGQAGQLSASRLHLVNTQQATSAGTVGGQAPVSGLSTGKHMPSLPEAGPRKKPKLPQRTSAQVSRHCQQHERGAKGTLVLSCTA